MATVTVKMSNEGGKIVTNPQLVEVRRGDTVVWISAEPDLTVSFDPGHPFTESAKGRTFHNNEPAQVRPDAPLGKHFDCTVTLGRVTQKGVNGLDMRPKG